MAMIFYEWLIHRNIKINSHRKEVWMVEHWWIFCEWLSRRNIERKSVFHLFLYSALMARPMISLRICENKSSQILDLNLKCHISKHIVNDNHLLSSRPDFVNLCISKIAPWKWFQIMVKTISKIMIVFLIMLAVMIE